MFYKARAMDIPDGLPKWSGMANHSALMEEHTDKAKDLAAEHKY